MRIAVILAGNSDDKKGAFISTHNRIKHLVQHSDTPVDVYLIQTYENSFVCRLRHTKKRIRQTTVSYDGIQYNCLWLNFSLIDYFIRVRLKSFDWLYYFKTKKWVVQFKNYDLISAHSYNSGLLAYRVNVKYKIPFTVTWHGSDIHSEPHYNKAIFKWTKKLIEKAEYNFFVSKNLKEVSEKITQIGKKTVLYNGVDKALFHKYNDMQLEVIRKKLNFSKHNLNVGFIGGLVSVKNAELLPQIFSGIYIEIPNTRFYVIGDGKLRKSIEDQCNALKIPVTFLGNLESSVMPSIINCMNLIILPSKNEGMPLVTLESLSCGVPVIGSRVGGIAESIGIENTVLHDDNFIEGLVSLAVNRLINIKETRLDPVFDWLKTAELETEIYNSIKNSTNKKINQI
jgi:glycosyltransferase involved in cell wall biosynthesis